MNAWKVRHEGSPIASHDLRFDQVMQAILDGRFSPTDEVKGPNDLHWLPLEDHPAFAEAAADIEPEQQKFEGDESRLDMTALIDVCLVLLVFFILTTSYVSLQKIIEAADAEGKKVRGARVVKLKDVESSSLLISVRHADGKSTVFLEKNPVALDDIVRELSRAAGDSKKRMLLLEHDAKVPHGVIVAIQDAAKTAGMEQVLLVVP
jgi:biopolymer transport protein ExbD